MTFDSVSAERGHKCTVGSWSKMELSTSDPNQAPCYSEKSPQLSRAIAQALAVSQSPMPRLFR